MYTGMENEAARYFLAENTLHRDLRAALDGEPREFQNAIREALVDVLVGDGAEENEPESPLAFSTSADVVRFYRLAGFVAEARDWYATGVMYVRNCIHAGACPCDATEVPVHEYFGSDHGPDGGDYPDQDR